jgi:lysophospholipase L1-like esterase
MMRTIALGLAAALALTACARPGDPRNGGGAGEMRFLALGDSYTIGEGVAEAERWPVQLAALLRERGVPVADPEIIARTGWTTDELSAAIDHADPRGPYALVSLLIGVNNQYRGRDAEEYRAELTGLLRRAVGFAGGDASRVLVLSIPDWGVTPFAEGHDRARIAAEIDVYNAINREEAVRAGARYVDVTPQTRAAGADPAFLVGDGLHPSGRTYAEWARLALPAVGAALAGLPPGEQSN